MERDGALLHYTGSHFSSAEPVRFNGGSVLSSSGEDEITSDSSSQDKPPRLHIMAGPPTTFAMEDEDDNYGSSIPPDTGVSNENNYGAMPVSNAPSSPARIVVLATEHDMNNTIDGNNNFTTTPKAGNGVVHYRECLKNHAASIGGHALDGCGEFLPSGTDGIDALTCSACGCHRNFHLREVDGVPACTCRRFTAITPNVNPSPRAVCSPPTPALLSLSASKDIIPHPQGGDASMNSLAYADDLDIHSGSSSRKKRHRTKFSSEQKEKMLEFAEKLSWRIARQDDNLVQQFCEEVGVSRHVFKVWMHNNKSNIVKRVNTGESDSGQNMESESPLAHELIAADDAPTLAS